MVSSYKKNINIKKMQQQDIQLKYAKLNVGGSLFYTTIGTLTKHDTMLKAMFSGRMKILTDTEEVYMLTGWVLIDRCGKHFNSILNFLRDEHVALPDKTYEIAELLAEAKFYLISPLVEACQHALRSRQCKIEPQCRVPLISSSPDLSQLITLSTKPTVKLLINRHNNKYSYTSASDDNLLKNEELFDKLSLRFGSRFLFIKDVSGSSEICCWSYFGLAVKVAEVCCTSIVYTTDKKHTKVDFPEARIYEECLNLMLYENRTEPDQELMQATSWRGAVSSMSSTYGSDDEEERNRIAFRKRLV